MPLPPLRWANLKKRVALSKQRIGPRVQANRATISQDLSSFASSFLSLRDEFHASRCLCFDCPGRDEAVKMAAGFRVRLGVLAEQARDLTELQELLEASLFNFSLLKE